MARARRTQQNSTAEVKDYRHDAKRKNNPPVGMVTYEPKVKEVRKQAYAYDPHLSPQLVWAGKAGLKQIEVEEAASCEVDTVSLHIHERVSTSAIVRAVQRPEPKQLKLFADPELPLHEAVEFYQHEMDWTNRLILGDSLLVMNSLLQKELMAGKVQMIYMDPPYGVKFSSNFQPRIDQRDVKDGDEHLTREPEQIKAYRDTWTLGVHSYLTYLRDRLILCRELLHESGSIFVQIGDENVHRVRLLMDEVFGAENFCGQIPFRTTISQPSRLSPSVCDHLLWYSKNKEETKFHPLFRDKVPGEEGATTYTHVELPDGTRRRLTQEEQIGISLLPNGSRIFSTTALTQRGVRSQTTDEGIRRLRAARRVIEVGDELRYVRYLDDFPVVELVNLWNDTITGSFTDPKVYVVQTNTKVISRCLLMTTDPGDLVFDPTCGSGTTAYVAEQWGRRWMTCDTSRVALALARQRLMTATFPYYRLADESRGVSGGFVYKTVPHITLKSIANNEPPDTETLYDQPEVERGKVRVSGPFTVEAIPPAYVEEIGESAEEEPSRDGDGADSHIPTLIELLRKDGVTFPNNRKMTFATLTPRSGGVLHAEGETAEFTAESAKSAEDENKKTSASSAVQKPLRVSVSFGPLYGQVTARQVEDGIREANLGGFDAVVFCGFAFDGAAQAAIDHSVHPRVKAFMAHIRPDVLMQVEEQEGKVNLLKTTANSQLFTVFGEPDVDVRRDGDDFIITLRGVDIYNPLTGEVHSDHADKIAAWFIDTDYDGRTFCICQAFFPDKSAWDKLQRALKGSIDEEMFDKLTGKESLPFPAGEHRRAAVKVIDHRGNEVIKVVELRDARYSVS